MIRVFICDDHAIVRKGFQRIIQETAGMQVVGEASNGHEVLAEATTAEWDVLVLDMSLPCSSALEVIKAIRGLRPKLPILVLSVHPEEHYAIRLLKSGIAGYVHKEKAPDNLLEAIRKVVAGGKYVSADLAEKITLDLITPADTGRHNALSHREYSVLCMIGEGKSVTQIAAELNISVKTVSTYRSRMLEKMALTTTADLIRYAIENKLH